MKKKKFWLDWSRLFFEQWKTGSTDTAKNMPQEFSAECHACFHHASPLHWHYCGFSCGCWKVCVGDYMDFGGSYVIVTLVIPSLRYQSCEFASDILLGTLFRNASINHLKMKLVFGTHFFVEHPRNSNIYTSKSLQSFSLFPAFLNFFLFFKVSSLL